MMELELIPEDDVTRYGIIMGAAVAIVPIQLNHARAIQDQFDKFMEARRIVLTEHPCTLALLVSQDTKKAMLREFNAEEVGPPQSPVARILGMDVHAFDDRLVSPNFPLVVGWLPERSAYRVRHITTMRGL